jgi:methyl-accepting chemotaxis protein
MNANQIDAEIRTLAQDRRLPAAHLEQWLAMDPASRGSMLTQARSLSLRTGQIVSALELLEEIAVRERVRIAEILSRDEIRRIADAPGSTPARASAFIDALRQARFPRLRKMQERLRAEIAALKLPRGLSLDLPKELGSDELTVSLRVRSADELDRLVAALNRSCAGIAQIVELLGGGSRSDDADEI